MINYGDNNCVNISVITPRKKHHKEFRGDKNKNLFDNCNVILLTNDMINSMNEPMAVLFFAPWCGHCQAFEPEYKKASNKNGPLYAVNCDEEEALAEKFKIKGFPTLLYIENGKEVGKFEGPRKSDGVLKWISSLKQKAGKPKSVKQKKRAMTGVEQRRSDSEEQDSDDLHITSKNVKRLTSSTFNKVNKKVVIFYAPWCGHCQHTMPIYEKVANDLGKTLYAVNCDKESQLAKENGITGFPTIKYICKGIPDIIFGENQLDGPRDEQGILKWAKRVMNGETNESGVENNLEVTDDTSDKLNNTNITMFYAPWCTHCKSAKPVFMELASHLKQNNIYMVNCDDNPQIKSEFSIQGYPTIYYINGRVQQDEYEGPREFNAMLDWVKSKKLKKRN
jgi:protein disulfide-isomerase A5